MILLRALPVTLASLALAAAAAPASGQTFSLTPTYQASFARYGGMIAANEYRALGLQVGVTRPGRWWAPHLWLQRYELLSRCPPARPRGLDCTSSGWSVSMGPAIEFVETPRLVGRFMPQVGVASRGEGAATGGAGVHLEVKAGGFRPQAFTRFDALGGAYYATVGVGVRLGFLLPGASAR